MINDTYIKRPVPAEQYLLVLLLVFVSGNSYFYYYHQDNWLIILFVISSFFIVKNRLIGRLNSKAILLIFLLSAFEVIQLTYFGGFNFTSVLGTLTRLVSAYFVIVICDRNFFYVYKKIIVVLASISLFFYALFYIPGITEALVNFTVNYVKTPFAINESSKISLHMIIFNFHGYQYTPMRNSGPFHEPGLFAAFLVLGIIFNTMLLKKFIFRKNLILIIALATTLSTAGYVALGFFVVLSNYLTNIDTSFVKRILVSILLIVFSIFLTNTLDFLGDKISYHYEVRGERLTRFGSAVRDIQLIEQRPLLGYSRMLESRFGTDEFDRSTMHGNNGITNLFVRWGLLAGLLIFYQMYLSFKHIVKLSGLNANMAFIFFASFLLLAFSQTVFRFSFFMGFIFFQFLFIGSREIKQS
jgi:hypothetical protein